MPHNETKQSVVIAWHGLPAYAARAIRATVAAFDLPLSIIGTASVQSTDYIESLIGRKITWIDPQKEVKWSDLNLGSPAIFFYTGWVYKAFNSLAAETKRNGGCTVSMVDNSRKHNLRQMLGKWYFRAAIRPNVDRFLVPGNSARELLKYFGVPESSIHQGLYGADCEVFSPGPPLAERTNDFVFIGQFIPRKGIHLLLEAAKSLKLFGRRFSVAAIGRGPLRQDLSNAGFRVEPFSSPEAIAAWLRRSRFLVLPSSEEHWGVVVHEAALSGCGLILSEAVGSCREFAGPQNSWRFPPSNSKDLTSAMLQAIDLDDQRQEECRGQSLALGKHFGPARWNESFKEILAACAPVSQWAAADGCSGRVEQHH